LLLISKLCYKIWLIIFILISVKGISQNTFWHNLKESPWLVSAGWNIVEDDGKPYKNFFVLSSLNYCYYPTRVGVLKNFAAGWSLEAEFNYNKLLAGKDINDNFTTLSIFLSLDINTKKGLFFMFKKWHWLDPYTIQGLGYTLKAQSAATLNIGGGVFIWFSPYKRFGMEIQSEAKFGLKSPLYKNNANYLHHSISFIYQLKRKGKYKLAKGLYDLYK